MSTKHELPDDDLGSLSAEERSWAATKWADRAASELQAAAGFAMVSQAAFALCADPEVLTLAARAPSDELHHAELCLEVASRYAGCALPAPSLRPIEVPSYPGADETLSRHLHLVSMGCVNETIAGAYLELCLDQATQPLARAALRALLADEIDHARMGWAHLGSARVGPALRAALGAWVVPLLDAHLTAWRSHTPAPAPAHGSPAPEAVHATVLGAIRDLVIPGLAHVGIATRAARAWLERVTPA